MEHANIFPQVARAGRFGTKGLAITFVSDEGDARTLNDVQDRFEVNISELPEEIDISSYSKRCTTRSFPESREDCDCEGKFSNKTRIVSLIQTEGTYSRD